MHPSLSTRALQDLGGRAFSQRKYQDALELYSQALQLATDAREAAVLSSNIAAVLLKLDRPAESLQYARASTEVNPRWAKGFYRQASALQALQQHTPAAEALQQALALTQRGTPEAAELSSKLSATTTAAQHQQQHEAAQRGLLAVHTAWAKNRAREAHTRSGLTQQLQQGMAGYAWDPEDFEWRLTWTPSMRAAAAPAAAAAHYATTSATCDVTTGDSRGKHGTALSTALAVQPDPAAQVAAAGVRLLSALEVPAGSTKEQQAQIKQLLVQLAVNLAELEAPQRGLRLLQDVPLLDWYSQNIQAAVDTAAAQRGRAPTVLVLANGGGGLLGLFAAAAGAARVVVVEKGRWGCRASQQLLEANSTAHQELVSKVELVPGPLSSCCFEGVSCDIAAVSGAECAARPSSSCAATGRYRLTHQADVVVTDLLDFSVLGQGIVGALQLAAAADLLCPDGVVLVPHTVTVKGQLVNSLMTQRVSGFDLSPVNRYKWHPTIEHIQHDRYRTLAPASPHITLQELDLASFTTPGTADAAGSSGSASSTALYPGCSADALLVWCELTASHSAVSTGPPTPTPNAATPAAARQGGMTYSTGMGLGLYYLDAPLPAAAGPAAGEAARQVLLTTRHSPAAVRLLFDVSQAACAASPASSTRADSDPSQAAGTCSTAGSGLTKASAAVNGSNAGCVSAPSLLQRVSWRPHGFPRHAWLPRWHFDMLADSTRNDAYEVSLRRAIARLRDQQQPSSGDTGGAGGSSSGTGSSSVHVLDLGAGTGLLSMLAVRCGADRATAVEAVRHMADTASHALALNRLTNINVVHKDARYLDTTDVPAAADLLVFEVFDCGCIGEGALHIVAAARKHLKSGARILPAAAQVYCQPIQYGAHIEQRARLQFDTTPLAPYAWQPDYFEADLRLPTATTAATDSTQSGAAPTPGTSSSCWTALAAPQPVFAFDFNTPDPATAFQPAQQALSFKVTTPGVVNAVAFWFELALDETTTLSSSPYVTRTAGPSTTWKQAVQLLPEQSVQPGQVLDLLAAHDTYALSFTLPEPTAAAQDNTPTPTGVPLFDPTWRAAYSHIRSVQSQIAKATTQDPLEHRRVAAAALQLAMTPWSTAGTDLVDDEQQQEQQRGQVVVVADPAHAAGLLTRLMG